MSNDAPIEFIVTHDNTNEYRSAGDPGSGLPFSALIRFDVDAEGDGSRYRVEARGPMFRSDGEGYAGVLECSEQRANQDINDFLDEWRHVLFGSYKGEAPRPRSGSPPRPVPLLPYRDRASLAGVEEQELADAELELARVGHGLFRLLFRQGDDGLRRIADRLVEALWSDDDQVLVFHSDDLCPPWWALYTPPLGGQVAESFHWRGFWGFRHLIEHRFREQPPAGHVPTGDDSRLKVTLNIDRRLEDHEPELAGVESFLRRHRHCTVEVRENRGHLDQAMRRDRIGDQIMYFCCHGTVVTDSAGARAQLTLEDDRPIRESHFREWLLDRPFAADPVVFMNTCHGARMSSQFYTSIGPTLLEGRASCIVGPHLELPMAFAARYATQLLERFLDGEPLGVIVRDLAHNWLETNRNPLGLMIGSYGGLTARVVARIP